MSEVENVRIGKLKVALIVSVAILVISLISNAMLYSQVTGLNTKYNDYKKSHSYSDSKYMELSINYSQLQQNYQTLTIEYETLREMYNQLQVSFGDLNITYSELRSKYEQLETVYQYLNTTYHQLLGEYEDLESEYQALNAAYHSYTAAYRELVSVVNLHVIHPSEDETLFISPEDPAVENKVEEITGGWNDPTDWTEYWTEVKMMYDWVVDHIEYRFDGLYPILPEDPTEPVTQFDEMWQFPNQTLNLRKGDCDDMAILLCSMIYCYGNMEYFVECIVIPQHMAVYIPVAEDKICILDPAGNYYTNTEFPYYEITSKDISEEVHNWLNYWSDGIENPEVQWIFSASIWKEFWDTNSFIGWLYER